MLISGLKTSTISGGRENLIFCSFRIGYLPELRTSCDKTSDLTQTY